MKIKDTIQAFTLLEVIIATFIFSSIVALVAIFGVYFFSNYSFSFEEQQQVGMAQGALTQMMREIRKAQNGDDGSWPLVLTNDNEFVFYADINGDGRSDRVHYFLSGTDLKRGITQPTLVPVSYPLATESVTTLVSNIDATGSAIFQYYNGNWPGDNVNNPLIASQRILNTRLVKATVRISTSNNFSAKPVNLSSSVTIRSMKTNL